MAQTKKPWAAMAPVRRRIEIDWQEVFTSARFSPDREASVFFAPPTARPEKRRGPPYPTRRLWGLRGKLEQRRRERCPGAVAGDGAPRRVTRAAAKVRAPAARSCVFVCG